MAEAAAHKAEALFDGTAVTRTGADDTHRDKDETKFQTMVVPLFERLHRLIQDAQPLRPEGVDPLCHALDSAVAEHMTRLNGSVSPAAQRFIERKIVVLRDQALRAVAPLLAEAEAPPATYAPWGQWNPRKYLQTYFTEPGPDTTESVKFFIRELRRLQPVPAERVLDFGCGPTIISALPAAPHGRTLHLADYLPENIWEIGTWLTRQRDSFDWDPCIREVLHLEGEEATDEAIAERASDVRTKARTLLCDASQEYPLLEEQGQYPLVISSFCADSATASKQVWREYMTNILRTVSPSGLVLLSALRKCTSYRVGTKLFPSANIDERDMERILRDNDFADITVEVADTAACTSEGFDSIVLASARKTGAHASNGKAAASL